jgi:amino acid adenylation domain-containing protein
LQECAESGRKEQDPRSGDPSQDEVYLFPASFGQQRLWYLNQLGAGSAYTIVQSGAFRIRGPLAVAVLKRSLAEIVSRHESLRTTFTSVAGEPMQVVSPSGTLDLVEVDLTTSPAATREEAANRRATAEAERPFDLDGGRLFRVVLMRLGEHDHILLMSVHHIVADGWSMGILFHELSTLYAAYRAGRPSPLPELPIQYPDFSVWQREWLQGALLRKQLDYWKNRLAGVPELRLPTRPRPTLQNCRAYRQPLSLSRQTTAALLELGRGAGATLFMTLLAAFQVLLARYSGQDDITVGSPTANRNRVEIEGLIGFFVNMLVLRTDLSGDPTFRELLGRVREVCIGAYAHQNVPFEKLVEDLRPERDTNRNPFFQATFSLQDVPFPSLALEGLDVRTLELDSSTVRFDLESHLWTKDGGISGSLLFAADLFTAGTAGMMVGHYRRLLEGIADDPDRRLSRLPLLTPAELDRVLVAWNDTGTEYPSQATIPELFEAWAERTPEAVAVAFGPERLTYRELNEEANRLAHLMRTLGVGPETPVGMCLEKSPSMLAATLGILKAGGAYVLLDPNHSGERLAFTVRDAGMPLLLTREGRRGSCSCSGARVLCLDTERELVAAQPTENPPRAGTAGSLAYVRYGSVSGGEPKGTCVQHRGVVRLASDTGCFGLRRDDVVLQLSPITTDAATFEIWGALLNGAQLVLPPGDACSLREIGGMVQQRGATVVSLTAAAFHLMVEHHLAGLRGTRLLVVGGDVPSSAHVKRALEALDGCRLVTVYGATEATVVSCAHHVRNVQAIGETVPLGHPVANTRVYVLDRYRQPVPEGVAGELYIGGDGLARGYLNAAELTAERFVADPFSAQEGARLFRTGDLARHRADGAVEFLGRLDGQVWVQDSRNAPREVETALMSHPAVREAVVVAGQYPAGDTGPVAYVVLQPGAIADGERASNQRRDLVAQWQDVFDATYGEAAGSVEPGFNVTGWNSSYTGGTIPREQMQQWVDETVRLIASQRPGRVLEIGCGTGLLLLRLVPACSAYRGTDLSAVALASVREQLVRLGLDERRVSLARQPADDFTGIEAESFDAVVLNSVVQYFPDANYLLKVLEGAVRAAKPGGFVFIGDVRNLALHESFRTSVELHRASPADTLGDARRRVRTSIGRETELLLDPRFFATLPRVIPSVAGVEIRLKHGDFGNELTKYRFDVLLYRDPIPQQAVAWHDWDGRDFDAVAVRKLLVASCPAAVGFKSVADLRLAGDLRALEAASLGSADMSIDDFRRSMGEPEGGAPLGQLRAMGRELGYAMELGWPGPGKSGSLDVAFLNIGIERPRLAFPGVESARNAALPSNRYANSPFLETPALDQSAVLQRYLSELLPDSMVPSALVFLPEMPLTRSGMIDLAALPSPEHLRDGGGDSYVAPRDDLEVRLAEVWGKTLGITSVGVRDNFFDLGGHSLLATRLIWEIERTIGEKLPLKALYRFTTVEEMAALIRERQGSSPRAEGGGAPIGEPTIPLHEHKKMLAVIASGTARPLRPGSLVTVLNKDGSRPHFFWCFNVPSTESSALAARLGPDQPLYVLYSGALVITWTKETARQLADYYVREIRSVQPRGPYFIGGNCGGARVACEIAFQLVSLGEKVARLCLMESFDPRLFTYTDRVLLLYGRESHLKAYEPFGWQEPGWQKAFLAPPEVDWIPGAHGEFFEERNVQALAGRIAAFLRGENAPREIGTESATRRLGPVLTLPGRAIRVIGDAFRGRRA